MVKLISDKIFGHKNNLYYGLNWSKPLSQYCNVYVGHANTLQKPVLGLLICRHTFMTVVVCKCTGSDIP